MPSFSTGRVTAVRSEREGIQFVEVEGRAAYVLTRLVGPVSVGDRVVVNTTAVDLGLGTGGWDVVHWNLSRDSWSSPGGGREMKLRYTSLQVDVAAAEREGPGEDSLEGVPVVACGLHSQVACVAAAFAAAAPGRRLVYVMTDSAALPLALSELVARLRDLGLVATTVSCGQAFGGDHEAVNLFSALALARSVGEADAVVTGPGPGTVGTGTRLGFGSLDLAASIDAANALGGRAVAVVRYSDADRRPRHRGVSHHFETALAMAARPALVAVPRGRHRPPLPPPHRVVEVDVPDMDRLLSGRGLRVTTMGRGPQEDPGFFDYAGAAGVVAADLLTGPDADAL